jgi:preprotein translocase subunit YajC
MDPLNYVLIIVAIGLVFLMFRNSRRNKARQEELKSKMVPGVEVMTNFGLYGTITSIDELSNTAELELAPGTVVKVHRQTLSKVVTPSDTVAGADADAPRSVEEAMERANREQEEREAESRKLLEAQGEPEFGERIEPVTDAAEPTVKPARRSTKKTAE